MRSALPLALLAPLLLAGAACDDHATLTPDSDTGDSDTLDGDTGDVPDTNPDANPDIAHLDWIDERGPSLDASEVDVAKTTLVAVHRDGFLTGGGCEAEIGCWTASYRRIAGSRRRAAWQFRWARSRW